MVFDDNSNLLAPQERQVQSLFRLSEELAQNNLMIQEVRMRPFFNL